MKEFLPAKLDLDWRYYFFNLEFKSFIFNKINQHVTAVQFLWEKPKSTLLQKITEEKFWLDLKKADGFKHSEIEELHERWQKRKPFAHLDTQELLTLFKEHIYPLENDYIVLQAALKDQEDGVLEGYKGHIGEQIEKQLKKLEQLQKKLCEELLFRCEVSSQIEGSRHVDDVMFYFCQKINALNLLKSPLKSAEKTKATLSDDCRLLIYDILSIHGIKFTENFTLEEIAKKVLPPFAQTTLQPLRTRKEIEIDLSHLMGFCRKILQDLEIAEVGDYLFALRLKTNMISRWRWPINFTELTNTLKKKIHEWKVDSLVNNLWKLRFLAYFALSLIIYQQLINILAPTVFIFVGIDLANKISSFLFYTIGMTPLWYLGWQAVKQMGLHLHKFLIKNKVERILSALIELEKSELFICNQLSPAIVDIAHLNVPYLMRNIEQIKKSLQYSEQQLKIDHFGEKWLVTRAMRTKIEEVLRALAEKQTKLANDLNLLATHMATHIEESIEILVKELHEEGLSPALSPTQMKALEGFVEKYGAPAALLQFRKSTNVVERFFSKIKEDQFYYQREKTPYKDLSQPWGEGGIREDLLKGWDVILSAFVNNHTHKESVLKLTALLQGKITLSAEALDKELNILKAVADTESLLKKIQWHVFATLTARPPEHAALLSDEQKALIKNWYETHKEKIKEAKQNFYAMIENQQKGLEVQVGDRELSEYYRLLDGADIYAYSINKTEKITKRQNSVRKLFEVYNGHDPRTYRLIRFVPLNEKESLIPRIAEKRLNWILNHLTEFPAHNYIHSIDKELFLHVKVKEKMISLIRQHAQFDQPYQEEMKKFLQACKNIGLFHDDNLLVQYERRPKPQLNNLQPCSVAVKDKLNLRKSSRVGVC